MGITSFANKGMNMRVNLSELVEAFDWVSVTGPFLNSAYVSRASGQIWLVSDFDDAGEEPPEDVGDETLYLAVPRQDELDLGRSLALRFVETHLPERHEMVKGFFRTSGAYARFKRLLEEGGHLDAWHAFEANGVAQALRGWAAKHGVELVEDAEGKL